MKVFRRGISSIRISSVQLVRRATTMEIFKEKRKRCDGD